MNEKIEQAKREQLFEILYIIRECAQQLHSKGVKYWHNTLADFYEIEKDINSGTIFVQKVNHVPVGTITLKSAPDNPKTLFIDRLAIYPAYQRKGLAGKLLTFAIDWGKKNGYEQMCGHIPIEDESLTRLLEENRFTRGNAAPPPKNDIRRIVFEKKL